MGQGFPFSRPVSSESQYLGAVVDGPIAIDPYLELEIRPSTLQSSFLDGANRGVFTKTALPVGTILPRGDEDRGMFNDGLVDLTSIIAAKNNIEMYQAWKEFQATYFTVEKANRMVNIRQIGCKGDPTIYLQVIKPIAPNEELLMMYGFIYWPLTMWKVITSHTIAGFAKFIHEISMTIQGNYLEQKFRTFDAALSHIISISDTEDLAAIDQRLKHTIPVQMSDRIWSEIARVKSRN